MDAGVRAECGCRFGYMCGFRGIEACVGTGFGCRYGCRC